MSRNSTVFYVSPLARKRLRKQQGGDENRIYLTAGVCKRILAKFRKISQTPTKGQKPFKELTSNFGGGLKRIWLCEKCSKPFHYGNKKKNYLCRTCTPDGYCRSHLNEVGSRCKFKNSDHALHYSSRRLRVQLRGRISDGEVRNECATRGETSLLS